MSELNKKSRLRQILFPRCDVLGVGVWSCPSFIFIIMGVVIVFSILATYIIAERHTEPEIVIAIVTLLTVFLLVITQILVGAFEKVIKSKQIEEVRTKEILDLKDQFVYLAVHDLAASATAVKWGLKMIEGGSGISLSNEEREIFSSIRTRNEQLISLVHQILFITRIERDDIHIHAETLNVFGLLSKNASEHWREHASNDVWYFMEISPDFPSIISDKTLFEEILNTLLTNAYEHSPQDKKLMTLHAKKEDSDILAISIDNSGDGIPEKLQKHIFEKFWIDERTQTIERAGFGLYIARALARKLGGDISFTSDSTTTSFTLRLPITPPTIA